MIAYRAMLDVPRELVVTVAAWLRAERRSLGTRAGTRSLTCHNQALMVLVWLRNQGDVALVGAGFGVSRATAYRYRDEVITVVARHAPDLHDALTEVAAQGWTHVVLDGKVFRTDRCSETTTSAKGETINAWYSGKHRAPGGLYWSASQLRLPTLADSGYQGAGQGVHTPIKQPTPAAIRVVESAANAPDWRARGILPYRRPKDPTTVVRSWLVTHPRITSGDYATLTGLTQNGSLNHLDRLTADGLLVRGEGKAAMPIFSLDRRWPPSDPSDTKHSR